MIPSEEQLRGERIVPIRMCRKATIQSRPKHVRKIVRQRLNKFGCIGRSQQLRRQQPSPKEADARFVKVPSPIDGLLGRIAKGSKLAANGRSDAHAKSGQSKRHQQSIGAARCHGTACCAALNIVRLTWVDIAGQNLASLPGKRQSRATS
jgi:hypothetical protein